MSIQQAIVTLIAAIISGVLATIVTISVNAKREKKQLRMKLAEEIFGNRYVLGGGTTNLISNAKDDFSKAMNKVPVIFYDNENVLKAYDDFHSAIKEKDSSGNSDKANEALITFMKTVCDASGIDCNKWNDSRIKNVFTI